MKSRITGLCHDILYSSNVFSWLLACLFILVSIFNFNHFKLGEKEVLRLLFVLFSFEAVMRI